MNAIKVQLDEALLNDGLRKRFKGAVDTEPLKKNNTQRLRVLFKPFGEFWNMNACFFELGFEPMARLTGFYCSMGEDGNMRQKLRRDLKSILVAAQQKLGPDWKLIQPGELCEKTGKNVNHFFLQKKYKANAFEKGLYVTDSAELIHLLLPQIDQLLANEKKTA